jgi:hypothetical protein
MRLVLVLFAVLPVIAADLRVGRAAVPITPPAGMPMGGYYRVRYATGVHDDLHAKALVLEQSGAKAAIVACDLVSLPRRFVDEARRLIQEQTGIDGSRVMISATHAHTSPEMGGRATNLDPKNAAIAKEWWGSLAGKIAESVRLADSRLTTARVRAGIGHEDSVAFNRRFHMKDGTVGWNPGKRNPNIVRPAGPIDPDVGVLHFESASGQPLATFVNHALHLDTVGGEEFSSDYPYTIAKILDAVNGPEHVTLFTMGTSGNVNHIDVRSAAPQKGHGEAARIGAILAAEVLRTMKRLKPVETSALQVRHETVQLPLNTHDASDVEKARQVVANYGKPGAAPFLEQVKAFRVLNVAERESKPLDAEVQVIALGDQVAWVGLPGEIFVELGKAIKLASPFPYTVISTLANGSVGYVPDRKAYPQGNYEVVSARMAAGSGEALVDTATRLLVSAR